MDSLNFDYENKYINKLGKLVAGFDEVGRGAFCGPVVVGCIGFRSDITIPQGTYLNDSKKLTRSRREKAYLWAIEKSMFYGIGSIDNDYIDKFGMSKALFVARQKAYDQAVERLKTSQSNLSIGTVLIDGKDNFYLNGLEKSRQLHIIGGDGKIASIAAASIIAKVYRDAVMDSYALDPKYAHYGWSSNKGYGTAKHIEAIKVHGPTKLHRKQFIKNYV